MENLPFNTFKKLIKDSLELLKFQVKLPNFFKHAQRLFRLMLIDLAHGETDVNQDVIAHSSFLLGEHADVDIALDAANLDLGNLIIFVDDFDNLAGYGQTHVLSPFIFHSHLSSQNSMLGNDN
ncbi:MAG: hypothetical protein QOI77_3337 [Blastocatellia bacterium]|nr:hypothetical protein [Blastocatellia bacterium]